MTFLGQPFALPFPWASQTYIHHFLLKQAYTQEHGVAVNIDNLLQIILQMAVFRVFDFWLLENIW